MRGRLRAFYSKSVLFYAQNLRLSKFFQMQIVDAKVHQLDFLLERIFLSLKEIMVTIIHGQ